MIWFTLPRLADDPYRGGPRIANGRILQVLDRGDRWQCGYVLPRGGWAALRARGIPALRDDLAAHVPEFAARLAAEPSLDRPAVLPGALGRAPRWWRPGFLLLGDAAHTMSPIGGVGILMAVADAVAAASVARTTRRRRGRCAKLFARPATRLHRGPPPWCPVGTTSPAQYAALLPRRARQGPGASRGTGPLLVG